MKDIFKESEIAQKIIKGVNYYLPSESIDTNNPFVRTTYDFDSGFYNGEFMFDDPVISKKTFGTPEEYGRRRIIAELSRLDLRGNTILDLGAGSLNILRGLADYYPNTDYSFVNCDISGPWLKTPQGNSSLENGTNLLQIQRSDLPDICSVQFDFNLGTWPFRERVFDRIVSSMAIHHAQDKNQLLSNLYRSLKNGGVLVMVDLFNKQLSGAIFTNEGKRGPEECGGNPDSILSFLSRARDCGFILDEVANFMLDSGRSFQLPEEIQRATLNTSLSLAINKALWYIHLRK